MTRLLVLFGLLALCAGCVVTTTEVVRVRHADGSSPASSSASAGVATHTVARGETLYSIAFRSGLDWRQVAQWNRLSAPYTIYPGQRLSLSAPVPAGATSDTVAATAPVASTPAPPSAPLPTGAVETRPLGDAGQASAPAQTPPAAAPPSATQPPPVPGSSPISTPVVTAPPTAPPPTSPPAATPPPEPVAAPPVVIAPSATTTVGGIQWRWPTQGELIQRFSTSDLARQGISIAGRSGQAVVAAADGEVVYSGSGLRGYGELIIVKHSPEYLSAYAHNRKRLVNEGQRVRAGQPIAELGRTGADRDKLHFEIRRGGKPVDPLGYLPRR